MQGYLWTDCRVAEIIPPCVGQWKLAVILQWKKSFLCQPIFSMET